MLHWQPATCCIFSCSLLSVIWRIKYYYYYLCPASLGSSPAGTLYESLVVAGRASSRNVAVEVLPRHVRALNEGVNDVKSGRRFLCLHHVCVQYAAVESNMEEFKSESH